MSTSKHPACRSQTAAHLYLGIYRVLAGAVARQCDTLGSAVLTGCLLALLAAPAPAQEPTSGGEAVGQALNALGLSETPREPADFVRNSRPPAGSLDFQPLAPKPEKKKARTPTELDALGAELEDARARNQRAARSIKALDAPARGPTR